MITPNRKEAELAVGYSLARREDLVRAGASLRESLGLDYLLITLGAEGMLLFAGGAPPLAIPTRAREVFDVSGAGDTVAALMALGLAQWGDPVLAATLANVGAGVVVGKVGTAPVFRAELARELGREGTRLEEKIRTPAELKLLTSQLQTQGKKVVFTNGCFDLLHGGHIKFLEEARRLGDALVVAVDSDASVRQVKGEGRPVIGEEQRVRILAALAAVDYVTVFTSDQLPELLAGLRPDILTKGSNYPEAQVAGREIVAGYGGQVVLVPVTEPVSVSDLIQRIKNGRGNRDFFWGGAWRMRTAHQSKYRWETRATPVGATRWVAFPRVKSAQKILQPYRMRTAPDIPLAGRLRPPNSRGTGRRPLIGPVQRAKTPRPARLWRYNSGALPGTRQTTTSNSLPAPGRSLEPGKPPRATPCRYSASDALHWPG